uniref:Putative adherens-junction anchoring domain-containing protein n=1 Tax=Calidris pygmaea TaxID=425635 RepID=A0A8C3J1B5_9CHAR
MGHRGVPSPPPPCPGVLTITPSPFLGLRGWGLLKISPFFFSFQQPLTSPGSVCSSRGSSVPGSPSSIVVRSVSCSPPPSPPSIRGGHLPKPSSITLEGATEDASPRKALPHCPIPNPTVGVWAIPFQSRELPIPAPQPLFFLAETDTTELNIYKKPPIYRQKGEDMGAGLTPQPPQHTHTLCPTEHHSGAHHGKHLIEDLIIESSKFPAAQPPDPNQPAKIETDYWPCPPSLAVVETEWRKRMASKRGEEEEEDLTEEMKNLRELQRQELSKVTSNLGKLILKEEMEKSLPIRRKTRSLPDRTPFHTSLHMGSYKSSSLPTSGRSTLTRVSGQADAFPPPPPPPPPRGHTALDG